MQVTHFGECSQKQPLTFCIPVYNIYHLYTYIYIIYIHIYSYVLETNLPIFTNTGHMYVHIHLKVSINAYKLILETKKKNRE